MTDLALGLHPLVPAARYHRDDLMGIPTLSSSIAKTLLAATPRHAYLQHPRLNPDFSASADRKFDLGAVVHELLLGRGGGYAVLDFSDYKSKAAQKARDEARAAGLTPILAEQHARAAAMTSAVQTHVREVPGCEHLLDPAHGAAEVVGLWRDIGGPWCRMMVDWIGPAHTDLWDIKTTGGGLSDPALTRMIENLGYDVSTAFYLRGMAHVRPDLAGRFRWRWVFVEDEPPYEVRVVEPDGEVVARGHRKAALAIAKWHRCLTPGDGQDTRERSRGSARRAGRKRSGTSERTSTPTSMAWC